MAIIQRIQTEFSGIYKMIAAIIGALRAVYAYNRALKIMEALKIKDLVNELIWNITQHSALSYSDALGIYEYLIEQSDAFKKHPKAVREFVMEMANRGHTADMIILYLRRMDLE